MQAGKQAAGQGAAMRVSTPCVCAKIWRYALKGVTGKVFPRYLSPSRALSGCAHVCVWSVLQCAVGRVPCMHEALLRSQCFGLDIPSSREQRKGLSMPAWWHCVGCAIHIHFVTTVPKEHPAG